MREGPAWDELRTHLRVALREPTPMLRELDAPPLPPVIRRPPGEDNSPLTASDKLERAVDKSLDRLNEALLIEPAYFDTDDGKLGAWRVVISAIEKALNTQVRVDQNRLRRKVAELDDNILARLDALEATLPNVPLLDLTAE